MKQQYFTPDISDIKIGYELEFYNWSMDEIGDPKSNYDIWEPTILDKKNVLTLLQYGLKGTRVPYLTKKQIKAEGWINLKSLYDNGAVEADKKSHGIKYILCWTSDNILSVWEDDYRDCIYRGNCKCINDFRLITKQLLNI